MLCRVGGCRFADTHVTLGHRCGACGEYGHGQLECTDVEAKRRLTLRTEHMPLHMHCTVAGCRTAHTHSTSAHNCPHCIGRAGEHTPTCPLGVVASTPTSQASKRRCPMCRSESYIDRDPLTVYAAADCVVCMEGGPLIVFPACRHACMCVSCFENMP